MWFVGSLKQKGCSAMYETLTKGNKYRTFTYTLVYEFQKGLVPTKIIFVMLGSYYRSNYYDIECRMF